MSDFETLFSNELENSYEQCTEAADSVLVKPGVENQLLVTHAKLIAQLEKEIMTILSMCASVVNACIRESL